jgi:two-component system, chemotaxis family, sensor kinase CheA
MARTLDKKMLGSFVQEVRGYLPQIRAHLTSLGKDPKQREALEETYRFVHTIKGASAMMGLAVLSHVTYYVEGTVEEIMGGQLHFDNVMETWIRRATDQIERYLNGLASGDVPEQAIVTDVVQSFRRLKGFPEAGDAAAIKEVLGVSPK